MSERERRKGHLRLVRGGAEKHPAEEREKTPEERLQERLREIDAISREAVYAANEHEHVAASYPRATHIAFDLYTRLCERHEDSTPIDLLIAAGLLVGMFRDDAVRDGADPRATLPVFLGAYCALVVPA